VTLRSGFRFSYTTTSWYPYPVSTTQELENVIDAFIAGSADFPRFRAVVEQQLARHPECAEPALERLESLWESGQVSTGMYALISQELQDSSKGDVTAGDITAPIGEPVARPPEQRERGTAPRPAPRPPPRDEMAPAPEPAREPVPEPLRKAPTPSPALVPRSAAPAAFAAGSVSVLPAARERPQPPRPPVLTTPGKPPPPADATSPEVGAILAGRYRLEALLERGGMGLVYRAADLGRAGPGADPPQVGLKLVNPGYKGRGAMRALEREASLLAELSHPGVVRMLGFERDGDSAFMIMELLEGERLRSRLNRSHSRPLPQNEAARIIRDLAEIVAYIHARSIVHRDLKPANVFLTASGELRLVDFGLAAPVGEAEDAGPEAPRAWTPLYASPQMLAGAPPEPRDDIYSLGCIAYEILAGKTPWGNLPGDEAARRRLKLARPAGMHGNHWQVIRRALSFRAADRPADAREFIAAFSPRTRRRRVLPWAAAALLGGIAAGITLTRVGPDPGEWPTARLPSTASPETIQSPPADGAARVAEGGPASGAVEAPAPGPAERPEPAEEEVALVTIEPEQAAEPAPPRPEPTPDTAPPRNSAPARGPVARPRAEPAPATPAAATPAPTAPAPTAQRPGPSALAFSASQFRIREGGGALRLELRRPAGYPGPLRALWRTVDGTAEHGRDFIGSPTWRLIEAGAGEPSLIIFIPIVDDSVPGPDVTFAVELRAHPQGPPLDAPGRALVTVIDDD
jgi:serine/threonine protein kinase